ncbi:MAG: hypothetical protein Q8P59_06975 [Dehalococcoidia bacterium]|nr:hypothetical protein [Dehalococcoidia bacterium]
MKARLGVLAVLLVALLTSGPVPSRASGDYPWPPLKVHLSSQVEGWNLTFLITLENLTDQPLEGLTVKAVPARFTRENTHLVDSWAGSQGQNPGVFDGVAVGWIHDKLAPHSKEGPFAFTVNFQRSAQAAFTAYAWVSWTRPVPGAFTSEELAVTPPLPEPSARPIVVTKFWVSRSLNTPPQTQFTDVQSISYVVELEGVEPGDLIDFRVYGQTSGELVASSGQRLALGLEVMPGGIKAISGGGIKELPAGSYRAEIHVNGTRRAAPILFEVVPYTGPPAICHGYGNVDVTLDSALAEEAARVGAALGARASRVIGPGAAPGSVRMQFSVEPEVGPEPNPRDKAMAETERIMAAIKERLAASLGIPKENMQSLLTAPDCRLVRLVQ